MSTVVSFEKAGFEAYLKKPVQKFILDLSGFNVCDVLKEYQNFKKKMSPGFCLDALIGNLKDIEKNFGITLQPLQITDDFYLHFYAYLIQKGLKPSTIETYFNQLRSSLSWGLRHNLQVSPTYDHFKIPHYERTKVALTPDEISLIYHYDIEKNLAKSPGGKKRNKIFFDTMDRIRCQFVLACSLGQRYSDIKRIDPNCFNEDKTVFSIVQQKTGNKAVVDIPTYSFDRHVVRQILEKYDYKAPYPHDISNFNHYLHLLLKTIGQNFNEIIKSSNKIRGKIVEEEMPKWKAIGSHTARRSFVTYNIARGFPEINIRRCTGHKDSRSFTQYVIWDNDR